MAALLKDGIVITRKVHKCHGCMEEIPKGTPTYHQSVADEGTVFDIYMCQSCRDWCKQKNCKECYELESEYAGYIKECKAEQRSEGVERD